MGRYEAIGAGGVARGAEQQTTRKRSGGMGAGDDRRAPEAVKPGGVAGPHVGGEAVEKLGARRGYEYPDPRHYRYLYEESYPPECSGGGYTIMCIF